MIYNDFIEIVLMPKNMLDTKCAFIGRNYIYKSLFIQKHYIKIEINIQNSINIFISSCLKCDVAVTGLLQLLDMCPIATDEGTTEVVRHVKVIHQQLVVFAVALVT